MVTMMSGGGGRLDVRSLRARVGRLSTGLGCALALTAVVAACVLRFFIAGRQPLWLDETWTAAIAAQPSFEAVWRQAWLDVNAPLYYGFMHLWRLGFGLSDSALRLPSAIFGALAPAVLVFTGVKGLSRPARLTWAALLALWLPGVWFAGDARCYTLLLLLCTLQTLAFARLLSEPGLKRALTWAGLSSLAILTHYHALIPTVLEGLAFLAVARSRALRTWPAALAFAPAVAWMVYHLPRVAAFAQPGIAWYPLLKPSRLGTLATYLIGSQALAWALLAIAAVATALFLLLGPAIRPARAQPTAALWTAMGCALLGAVLVIAVGFFRPSFTDRYLIPFVPGALLGVALIVQALAGRVALVYAAVVVAVVAAATPWADHELSSGWRFYNWGQASADLARAHPSRVVFVWDHPASAILTRDQLQAVGGFFFRRAHNAVPVEPVVLSAARDPNPILAAQMAKPRTALIWAYDVGVQGTAARRFKPHPEALGAGLTCHDYGRGSVGVLACAPSGWINTASP